VTTTQNYGLDVAPAVGTSHGSLPMSATEGPLQLLHPLWRLLFVCWSPIID